MSHHSFGEFNEDKEEWLSYTERLQEYFTANEVEGEEKKRAVLLSACGATTYQLIRNLTAPAKPSSKTFKNLVELVQQHKSPKPSVIVQRYSFHTRQQKEGESIADFVADLRKISDHCNFGATLTEMLRDRLVCGIRNTALQRRLLAEEDLTFDRAFSMCQAFAAAERDTRDIQSSQKKSTSSVLTVKKVVDTHATQQRSTHLCYRCLGKHFPRECPFKQAICHHCSKRGHIQKACFAKHEPKKTPGYVKRKARPVHVVEGDTVDHIACDECSHPDTYTLFHVSDSNRSPIIVSMLVQGIEIPMEVNTGAAVSLISEATYKKLLKETKPQLQPTNVILKTYTGQSIEALGQLSIDVQYGSQKAGNIRLLVIKGDGPSLLGRNWLSMFRLNWKQLCLVKSITPNLDSILEAHAGMFRDELGKLNNQEVDIVVQPDSTPIFCRSRPVPHSLRAKVEEELLRLENEGVIQRVERADWAAPIVPVVKPDKSVRICGDYRMTVNKVAKLDSYPLPRIEDIFTSLAGGKHFSKLDVAHAYLQLPLKDSCKQYTTINTHKGLFQYLRLPFGVSAAPLIFQRTMETLLAGIPHVSVYIDDILVTGTSDEEHIQTLEQVLTRLESCGMRLKKSKCVFFAPSVKYLGHSITVEGLAPTDEKVQAVKEAPAPQNVGQLRSFLGMISYYNKFLPNLASQLAPLHKLLEKNRKWEWTTAQEEAFQTAKSNLTSECLLVHYDPLKELVLECDASPYGLGAVLSHPGSGGQLQPIAYASRSLAAAERNYSQLEREGLAIVWGVKKFHQYLYGRKFVIYSDHKPLQSILNPSRHISTMASARTQRWALTLSAYDYSLKYKSCSNLANADSLSRLPLPLVPDDVPMTGEALYLVDLLDNSPITSTSIRMWTEKDPTLSKVSTYILQGWPSTVDDALRVYHHRRNELSVEDRCLLWGSRVVVPERGRRMVLQLLHEGHPGITRMKSLARSVVWWPGIDSAIEEAVKTCLSCQENAKSPPPASIHPWEWPSQPWSRIHIDYAGPFLGKMFLVVVDAHSKWIEVVSVPSATSSNTIKQLRAMFARYGLPQQIVSDNGTSFTSAEFHEFVKKNGIHHRTIAPYHPSSNGLAERAVQSFKRGLKKDDSEADVETKLARFLFHHRSTPTATGISPSELFLKRRMRTQLELLRPDLQERIRHQQQKTVDRYKAHSPPFEVDDPIFVRNYSSGPRWIPARIVSVSGSSNFDVESEDGRILHRHPDQIRRRCTSSHNVIDDDDCLPNPPSPPPLRRSTRTRHPPSRYQPSWN